MDHYFNRFPVVNYLGVPVRNIMARAALDHKTKNNSANFGVVRLENDVAQRADIIAENYYGSPLYDWLFYFSNEVVDPYNDVFLDSDTFYKFIVSKYGSIQYANDKVLGYINNWADMPDDKLTVLQYEQATQAIKKYYTGVIDYANRVTHFERIKADWFKSTNKIRQFAIDFTDFMLVGGVIVQYNEGVITARGQIVDIDTENSYITLQHITGEFTAGELYRAGASTVYTASSVWAITPTDNISDEESRFWSPYTAYQMENERNESKRTIKLLRASLKGSAEEQLTDLMRS